MGFALLLAFSIFFFVFDWVFFSSGSVFFDIKFLSRQPSVDLLIFLGGFFLFLFFYSVFVVLMVFSVRNHLSKVKLHYYIAEKIRKFAFKYFLFLVMFSVFSFLLLYLSSFFPGLRFLAFGLLTLVFLFFLFLPQSIVVDEESLYACVQNCFEFSLKNIPHVLGVFFAGVGFFVVLVIIEFLLDYFFLPGEFFTLFLSILFVVPFTEALKTAYYMEKFGLVKTTSLRFL